MSRVRRTLKGLLPPVAATLMRSLGQRIRWSGDYRSWEAAAAASGGYAAEPILAQVEAATRRVLAGQAAWERDGVCQAEPGFRWPLATALLRAAADRGGRLAVLDLGGALGSTWLQHRALLDGLDLRWTVVEQPSFVLRGRALHQDGEQHRFLRFESDLEQALAAAPHDLALLASVAQYLPDPRAALERIAAAEVPWLVLDRTACTAGDRDRITVQHVPASIYRASYPCRFLAAGPFLAWMASRWDLVAELPCDDLGAPRGCRFRGFLFRLRGAA